MRRALLFLLVLLAPAVAVADEAAAWRALTQGGHVALIRHANAPGNWDPPGFKIDDCATQRNLDDAGRAQARALGEEFRRRNVKPRSILSSPWCRCLDTARLLDLGAVESVLTVASSAKTPERLAALRKMIADWRGPGTLFVVTHALTVQGLVGELPGSAETVVVKPERKSAQGAKVIGRIAAPQP